MKPFLVTPQRLNKELSMHGKGQGKGVLNWFINSEDDGKHYIYYVYVGVTYLCISSVNDLPIDLKLYLGNDNMIIGVFEDNKEDDIINYSYLDGVDV